MDWASNSRFCWHVSIICQFLKKGWVQMKTGEDGFLYPWFVFTNLKSYAMLTSYPNKYQLINNSPEWACLHNVNYVSAKILDKYHCLRKCGLGRIWSAQKDPQIICAGTLLSSKKILVHRKTTTFVYTFTRGRVTEIPPHKPGGYWSNFYIFW